MARLDRVYLDTNVFVRLLEGNDSLSSMIGQVFFIGRGSEPRVVTSELTLAETLVIPHRDQDTSLIAIYSNWIVQSEFLEVASINRGVLLFASLLRAQYPSLKLPDAIHVSTAMGTRCTHILSGDRRLQGRYEVTGAPQIAPGWIATASSVEVIPLDLATVESVLQDLRT